MTIIDAIIGRQLRGKLALDWAEAGLVCEIILPPAKPDLTEPATQSPQLEIVRLLLYTASYGNYLT